MKLLLVGDVMLGRLVNDLLRSEPPEYPWGDTLPLFRQADWRACNLECVISDRGSPWSRTPKTFHFRSDARNVAVLKAAGIDAVSLANNHTLDFDYRAMFDMLRILDRNGIARSGAGANLVTAAEPAITDVNGFRIGWLSFTDNQPEWEATPDQGGVFHMPVDVNDERTMKLFELVRYTRQRVDLLVVSAHWGGNWGYSPPLAQVEFGQALVMAGADVIVGHSPHVFRGIELYQNRPIIYSAGDFIDDYAVDRDERNDQSFIFVLEFEGQACRALRLHPTEICHCQARLAKGTAAREIAEKMTKLCGEFGTPARWDPTGCCLEIAVGRSAKSIQAKTAGAERRPSPREEASTRNPASSSEPAATPVSRAPWGCRTHRV